MSLKLKHVVTFLKIFALWLRKFSSLGILQNLDVSESALKHKHMEKNLGSIRGRQATVDALIANKHYPTIRRLRTHSDWLRKLSQRTLFGYQNYQMLGLHERESTRVTDGLTYIESNISGYAYSRQVATKTERCIPLKLLV